LNKIRIKTCYYSLPQHKTRTCFRICFIRTSNFLHFLKKKSTQNSSFISPSIQWAILLRLFFFFWSYLYLDNADTNNYKPREGGRGSLGQKHLALFNSSLFFLLEYSGSVYKCFFCTQLQHANAAHTFSSFPSRMTSAYTLAQGYTNCGPRDIFGLRYYELSNLPFFLATCYHFLYLVSFIPIRQLLFPMFLGSFRKPIYVGIVVDTVDMGHTSCWLRQLLLSEIRQTNAFEGIQVELIIFGCISGSRGHPVFYSRCRIKVLWYSSYQKESINEDSRYNSL